MRCRKARAVHKTDERLTPSCGGQDFFQISYCNLNWKCYSRVLTTDKRLCFNLKVFIQLNYKGITTVYVWQIGHAKLSQLHLKSN